MLALLPRYLEKDGVVAVGEIGYDDQTDAEDQCFAAQIELAREYELPVLIHTPHRDKKRGHGADDRAASSEMGFPPERTLIDHNNEETLPLVARRRAAGRATRSIPHTKMDESAHGRAGQEVRARADHREQRRRLGGQRSAEGAEDGAGDARGGDLARRTIELVVLENPVRFFAQSGRLELEEVTAARKVDQRQLLEGNSVLRGPVAAGRPVGRPPAMRRTLVLNVVGLTPAPDGRARPEPGRARRSGARRGRCRRSRPP